LAKHPNGCTQNCGWHLHKSGTHLHDKNSKKIYGWFTGCCRGVVTGCEQTSDKTTSTTSPVKNVMSSGTTSPAGAAVRLCVVTVTDPDTRQYKFDIFAILHPTSKPTLPPNTRIHHFDNYNNTQQLSVKLRHTCVYRLISPKSVGASNLIVSCHFITDIIIRTDCDVTMRL